MPIRLLVILALGLSLNVAADPAASQPIVRVKKAGENFHFEICKKSACEPLGRESGYTRGELEKWKKFRESTAGEMLPLMAFVGAIALTIGSLVLFPLGPVAAAGAIAFGGFAYFFSKSPQVQAGMPNAVYHEFQSDPALLPSLKSFLLEIDQGLTVADQHPRVLSGYAPKKTDKPEAKSEAKPSPPLGHAR